MKTVYLVCATGIATSTMLRVKVEKFLEEKGIEAEVFQYRVAELNPDRLTADAILATTEIPPEFHEKATVINGIPLITGVGQTEALEELAAALKAEED